MMSGANELLLQTAERVFREKCTAEVIEATESTRWDAPLWDAMAEVGLPWVGIDEDLGGVGGSFEDALGVLQVAGRFGVPAPLAETASLAGWLLSAHGLPIGTGPSTVAVVDPRTCRVDGRRIDGVAHRVPWAREAEQIVVLVPVAGSGLSIGVTRPADAAIEPVMSIAGEPRDTVRFTGVEFANMRECIVSADDFERRGALTRVALMAGALDGVDRLTREYTTQRQQFGQAVRRFQLVQQHLVRIAQDAALVRMALAVATRAVIAGDGRFEIAAAKSIASQAATTATKAAHQAHGAMGMTREYGLHRLTRRLWVWRTEYGNDRYWNLRAGHTAVAAGADNLYPFITRQPSAG